MRLLMVCDAISGLFCGIGELHCGPFYMAPVVCWPPPMNSTRENEIFYHYYLCSTLVYGFVCLQTDLSWQLPQSSPSETL